MIASVSNTAMAKTKKFDFKKSEINALFDLFTWTSVELKSGQVLYKENSAPKAIYYIRSGSVKLVRDFRVSLPKRDPCWDLMLLLKTSIITAPQSLSRTLRLFRSAERISFSSYPETPWYQIMF
jgi:hypothetical protein